VAATGTQSAGRASAMAWSQSWSRPLTSSAGASGRRTITQSPTLCVASDSASSRSGLYSTIRLPSMPQEAETTTFGRASSMRTASSRGAKPPNTTECTAPMRAHASIATTAWGIIGRYSTTRSPRSTPRPRSTPANRAVSSRSSRYVKVRLAPVTGLS
jgi:hypothetical protein